MIFRSFISKQEVQELDLIRFDGEIEVIDELDALHDAITELSKEYVVGFDTETKPSFRKGEYHAPAIIQLSTMEKAYLIRTQKTGYPPVLIDFLQNKKVRKVGISIRDDLKDLQKAHPFRPQGFFDLNHTAERLGITQIGVRSLTGIFIGKRVSKGQQTSNWENETLTEAQQTYAATDAWICLKIFLSLEYKGFV